MGMDGLHETFRRGFESLSGAAVIAAIRIEAWGPSGQLAPCPTIVFGKLGRDRVPPAPVLPVAYTHTRPRGTPADRLDKDEVLNVQQYLMCREPRSEVAAGAAFTRLESLIKQAEQLRPAPRQYSFGCLSDWLDDLFEAKAVDWGMVVGGLVQERGKGRINRTGPGHWSWHSMLEVAVGSFEQYRDDIRHGHRAAYGVIEDVALASVGLLETWRLPETRSDDEFISFAQAGRETNINRGIIHRYATGKSGKNWEGPLLELDSSGKKIRRGSVHAWATAYNARQRGDWESEGEENWTDEQLEDELG